MAAKFKGDFLAVLSARTNGTPLRTRQFKAGDDVPVLAPDVMKAAIAKGVIDAPKAAKEDTPDKSTDVRVEG